MPKKRSSTVTPESWWQLRIELLSVDPRVWRRVFVPNTIVLPKLDRVIQLSMGWTNSHLHEFVIGGVRYGVPDPDFARELAHVDEKNVELKDALGANARCFDYVYDFGDDWHHQIDVVKIAEGAAKGKFPRVTKRVGESPPQYVDWDEED